jgi:hypothetical protein
MMQFSTLSARPTEALQAAQNAGERDQHNADGNVELQRFDPGVDAENRSVIEGHGDQCEDAKHHLKA